MFMMLDLAAISHTEHQKLKQKIVNLDIEIKNLHIRDTFRKFKMTTHRMGKNICKSYIPKGPSI